MTNFDELRKNIFKDAVVSDDDVSRIRDAMFEGEMDKKKGDFLFYIKDNVVKGKQSPLFKELFIECIVSLLLEDEISPGEIDEEEAKWLRAKLQIKGYLDDIDRELLDNLRKKSINCPKILNYKSTVVRFFERRLYSSRFLTLLSVIGSIIAAVALFIKGTMIVFHGIIAFWMDLTMEKGLGSESKLLEAFVESIDMYLFAMVLIIFGVGVYELFISKMDPIERQVDDRPLWLQISSIDDLKSALGKVILMILIVSFFRYSLELGGGGLNPKDMLFLAIGIFLISAALYLTHRGSAKSDCHNNKKDK